MPVSLSPGKPTRATPEYQILWHLNQRCNFSCEYCFRIQVDPYRSTEHPDCGKYNPRHIARCLDNTGKTWRLHLSGGEPFLYPQFVDLAKALTRNHCISMNTNLSTSNTYEFADAVSPPQVHSIHANLHIQEREKIEKGVRGFLERFLYFQAKEFNIYLVHIAYPPLLPQLPAHRDYFLSRGVKVFYIKLFRGMYEGKMYPQAYTPGEKILIKKHAVSQYELKILEGKLRFFGRPCAAGQKAFHMDVAGNLTRCNTINKPYGNLFMEKYAFDEVPTPCPAPGCGCPYQGMKFALPPQFNFFSTLRRRMEDYPRIIKQRILGAVRNSET